MPIIHRSGDMIIKKTWLRQKVSVKDIRSGRRERATPDQLARCALFLRMQAGLDYTTAEREFVIQTIFSRFGMTVLHPSSLPATMFMEGDGSSFMLSLNMVAKGDVPDIFGPS